MYRMKYLLLLLLLSIDFGFLVLIVGTTISCCFLAKGTVGMVVKTRNTSSLIRIPQKIWREAAHTHQQQIYDLLKPGLITTTTATATKKSKRNKTKSSSLSTSSTTSTTTKSHSDDAATKLNNVNDNDDWIAPLDPKHPVYNFLIEYYGLKGSKGTRRLARWSPSPNLFLLSSLAQQQQEEEEEEESKDVKKVVIQEITSIEQLYDLSSSNFNYYYDFLNKPTTTNKDVMTNSSIKNSAAATTILLEGATESDFANTLHLKGSIFLPEDGKDGGGGGVAYTCPSQYYGTNDKQQNIKSSSSFLWYKSILQQTLDREPTLNCFGTHEWAMLYHPDGADPPPSAKYQSHLPMRVSRQIINDTVESRGISCTHVDALRFFAKDALPLNKFGNNGQLSRKDQIRFEQPACVHANMDLLKLTLKLQPYVDSTLLRNVLRMALESRKLDVGASPYDATQYDGIDFIYPIETPEGRAKYKKKQYELMKQIQPIRQELLNAYDMFLKLAFDDDIINLGLQELPHQ